MGGWGQAWNSPDSSRAPCDFFFFFFLIFRAASVAYGSSWVRGRIGLQLPAYITATAVWDPSSICDLHHSLQQRRILNHQVIAHSQYLKSKRISIFLSMPDEIETEEIIRDIFQQGKTCFIPRYQFQSNHMDMVKLASPEEISSLPKTSWNIHQPGENEIREEALSTGGLDLIFMPGLGFDNCGNRLGRGKGYYDTYLKRCLQSQDVKPYTLALAFKEQICLQVPMDEHDMKVDEVLYEDSPAS
uniref:5-formyltetrahydrofolate cyclo-ligase n=1 Tax=Sus scrofa TaxID=9823 RepID=A0A8D1KNP4_PIG